MMPIKNIIYFYKFIPSNLILLSFIIFLSIKSSIGCGYWLLTDVENDLDILFAPKTVEVLIKNRPRNNTKYKFEIIIKKHYKDYYCTDCKSNDPILELMEDTVTYKGQTVANISNGTLIVGDNKFDINIESISDTADRYEGFYKVDVLKDNKIVFFSDYAMDMGSCGTSIDSCDGSIDVKNRIVLYLVWIEILYKKVNTYIQKDSTLNANLLDNTYVFKAIKEYNKNEFKFDISEKRIKYINFNSQNICHFKRVEVGKLLFSEKILAILESKKEFLVCTTNRGGLSGFPYIYIKEFASTVKYFK